MSGIFQAGVFVGFHKAMFGRSWGENYERNFGMMDRDGIPGGVRMMGELPNTHGAVGKVIKIELPTIIVIGVENIEKSILITDDTIIQKGRSVMTTADMHVDDQIVVIGSPNEQGQIQAKFIRIMPATPTTPLPSSIQAK